MTFRYPQELNTADVDYVVFTPHQYVANSQGGNGPATGSPVVLYMPTSTPAVSNDNEFGVVKFEGALGAAVRDLSTTAARGAQALGGGGSSVDEQIKKATAGFGDGMNNLPKAASQLAVQAIAAQSDADPNQLMALANGQIYNPNIELLYKGPKVRGFNFSYTFVPKSAKEAAEVNKIIKHFKIHHSPADTGNGMFQVPDVFSVVYMYKGGVNPNMNQFKRAALTNITVQANPGLPMHMSFENGMPIVTQMSMTFQEVDVITRDDHESSFSNIGY